MDTKKLAVGTIAGGITLFLVGYLLYELALGDFFAANAGSAQGVMREATVMWAVFAGNLSLAALLTLAILKTGASGMGKGFKVGGIVGFLMWLGVDLIYYGISNMMNLNAALVDALSAILYMGVGGAVIAIVVNRGSSAAGDGGGRGVGGEGGGSGGGGGM